VTTLEKIKATQKRYNFVLPTDLYNELFRVAENRNMKVIELLRMFVKLGLWLLQELESPGTQLVIKNGDKERELLIFN
jgi:hypothetical protein